MSLCGGALGRWWPYWGNDGLTTTNDIATTPAGTNSDENSVVPFNQALSFIDSASDYIQPISNIIFGFLLIKMFVIENDRGCKLPSGLRVQNGWRQLSTNCQEECFCMRNEFNCRSKACDLNVNQCVVDAFGDNFCYSIDTTITPSSTITPETTSFPYTTTTTRSTITLPTTSTPSTTLIPSFAVDSVIDIQRNQKVGTIDNYYQNYEFSMEVKSRYLPIEEPLITGFLIKSMIFLG